MREERATKKEEKKQLKKKHPTVSSHSLNLYTTKTKVERLFPHPPPPKSPPLTDYMMTGLTMPRATVIKSSPPQHQKERSADSSWSSPSSSSSCSSSLKHLCHQLEWNLIQDIRLMNHYYKPNEVQSLLHALSCNTSITSVTVGTRFYKCLSTSTVVLLQIATLPNLQKVTLSMGDHHDNTHILSSKRRTDNKNHHHHHAAAESMLLPIVQCPTLRVLEIRHASTLGSTASSSSSSSLLTRLLENLSSSITVLKLIHCGLNDTDILQLSKFTQYGGRGGRGGGGRGGHPLQELNLRLNPNIGPVGYKELCQYANIQRLDITSCNVTLSSIQIITESIPKSKTLQELSITRNELLQLVVVVGLDDDDPSPHPHPHPHTTTTHDWEAGASSCGETTNDDDEGGNKTKVIVDPQQPFLSFCHFAEVCIRHLKHLDLSYCELGRYELITLFDMLSGSSSSSSYPPPPPHQDHDTGSSSSSSSWCTNGTSASSSRMTATTTRDCMDNASSSSSSSSVPIPTTLESLYLHGHSSRVLDGPAIQRCLLGNQTLKEMKLDRYTGEEDDYEQDDHDGAEENTISILEYIQSGLEYNYTLQRLHMADSFESHPRIRTYLELNCLGRYELIRSCYDGSDSGSGDDDDDRDDDNGARRTTRRRTNKRRRPVEICNMLAKASATASRQHVDAMYWLLQNGAIWV